MATNSYKKTRNSFQAVSLHDKTYAAKQNT